MLVLLVLPSEAAGLDVASIFPLSKLLLLKKFLELSLLPVLLAVGLLAATEPVRTLLAFFNSALGEATLASVSLALPVDVSGSCSFVGL